MIFLKIVDRCCLIFIFALAQSCHAAITCPPSSVKFEKLCHHSQVSVPFPFQCDAVPLNYCHKADNLLQLNNSTKIYLDGNRIFDSDLIDDCQNDLTTTYSKHGHWQIKFDTIQNIYAVLVRTLGPARNQTNSLRVSLSRRVSSNRSESTQCHDLEYFDGYHIFYCHQLDVDEVLTSNYRPGFDAKFVDIVGELYIDDSCDFTNIVKVYSYPVRVCGIPESHHNQTINPYSNYYLVGQQVTYRCSNDAHTLIGRPDRVCQHNGLWSGTTPICVLVHNVQPQTELVMGKTETYWPANSLAKAKRIDENEMITYSFEVEYCIKRLLLEYHSELSERTDLSVYTTSIDGIRHNWTANGTFGFYANKQYFLPAEDHQPFVCCLNLTVQRRQDIAVRGIFKRFEFIYQIEAAGYRHRTSHCVKPHLFPNVKFPYQVNHTIENGVTVELQCAEGFSQQNTDPAEIQCENGMWKGRFPICERKHCPQPGQRSHSSWKYLENSKGLKFNQVHYKCDHGFELQGRSVATCMDGRWTTPSPTCKVTFCPSVTMPPNLFCMLNRKNEFYDATGNAFHHGISLVCYCQLGFRVIGNRTVQCNNQEWTSEFPICQEIFCESPPFLIPRGVNHSIAWQRHWPIGLHNFTCPEKLVINGYDDQTSMELICQENGEWGGTEVFECVHQGNNELEGYAIAGIVIGGILGLILISVSAVCVKRKAVETRKINESTRHLTIVEDVEDNNPSYISYSEEMDSGSCLALVNEDMTKADYNSTYSTELSESSESEIDVET